MPMVTRLLEAQKLTRFHRPWSAFLIYTEYPIDRSQTLARCCYCHCQEPTNYTAPARVGTAQPMVSSAIGFGFACERCASARSHVRWCEECAVLHDAPRNPAARLCEHLRGRMRNGTFLREALSSARQSPENGRLHWRTTQCEAMRTTHHERRRCESAAVSGVNRCLTHLAARAWYFCAGCECTHYLAAGTPATLVTVADASTTLGAQYHLLASVCPDCTTSGVMASRYGARPCATCDRHFVPCDGEQSQRCPVCFPHFGRHEHAPLDTTPHYEPVAAHVPLIGEDDELTLVPSPAPRRTTYACACGAPLDRWRCDECGTSLYRLSEPDRLFLGPAICASCAGNGRWRFKLTAAEQKRPTPQRRVFGMELELEASGMTNPVSRMRNELPSSLWHYKGDGSLNNGFELVTHPMSFDFFTEQEDTFVLALKRMRDLGIRATRHCGLHIHIDRRAFTPLTFLRFSTLLLRHPGFIESISRRRDLNWMRQYANPHEASYVTDTAAAARRKAKYFSDGVHENLIGSRYVALNTQPEATVELRFFAASSMYRPIAASMQFADAAITYAGVEPHGKVSPTRFKQFVESSEHRKRYAYLRRELAART